MPILLVGEYTTYDYEYTGRTLDYDYPEGMNLSPKTKLHRNIVGRLMQLVEESHSIMSESHPKWRMLDEIMTAFIPLSDYEKMIKKRGGSKDQFHGRNRPVSVVVPFSYATHETIMTYMAQAFLTSPIMQFGAVGPEDTIKARLLEQVVDAQNRRFKAALAIHTAISDGLKYGLGVSTFEWREVWGKRPVLEEVQEYDGEMFLGTRTRKVNEKALLFEGNKISPIDPYRLLPDPNVSAHEIQEGEFLGWVDNVIYSNLLTEERDDDYMFNVRYLNQGDFKQRRSRYTPDLSSRNIRNTNSATGEGIRTNFTSYITVVNMFVKLIPKEWKLPGDEADNKDGEYPETWLFTIANDTLLIRAARHNLNHGMYPVAVAAPDFDGYSITPVSRLEMQYGLQEGMNWLFNSHMTNVRKAINDMLIVDPSLIVMKDLENPEPGKLVRIRRKAWGRGVEDAVKQLAVADVTRGNIGDSAFIMDIMQRVSAAADALQGIVRSGGERRSATEYRSTVTNALSRLEHLASLVSLQYLHDLSYMSAAHTQQFMSVPVYTQIVGEWPEVLSRIYAREEGLTVTPEDILVDYDIIIKDGSIPTAGAANAEALLKMFEITVKVPELLQVFDPVRLFTRIATMLGDKSPYDFVRKGGDINPLVASDEDVRDAAQAGNVVPLRG